MATFADKPTIRGDRIVLRPLGAQDAVAMWADLHDDQIMHFTGTHAEFTRAQIEAWCASRPDQTDRLDLAVTDADTGVWLGEVVINDWDPDNRSCNFRIALSADARNRGVGTEATHLLVDHVFDTIDDPPVHRLSLEVSTSTRAGWRSTRSADLCARGCCATRSAGEASTTTRSS